MPVALEYVHLVYPTLVPLQGLLYGRDSFDEYGNGSSVEAQIGTGRELCAEFGIQVVETFEDPGISASRYGRKDRLDFEALIDAIRSRRGNIVVAFEASRYYRDLEQYVRLRKACMEAGVLLCYNRMVYDLSKKEDRKQTAQDAIAAEEEVDNIRDRSIRTSLRLAKQGKPNGKIIFGYRRRYDADTGELLGQVLHDEQAPVARRCWEDVDAGKSTYAVALWLNGLGETARRASGAPWTAELVRDMLVNVAYIGKRTYRGTVIADATWPALLEGEDGTALFNRVVARLSDPARRTMKESKVAHLLSRIALCGECGDHAPMEANGRAGRPGAWHLRCTAKYDTTIKEQWVDSFVETGLLTWLSSPSARDAFLPQQGETDKQLMKLRTRVAALSKQLLEAEELAGELDDETNEPRLSASALATLQKKLIPAIKKAEREIEEMTAGVPQSVKDLVLAHDPWRVWYGDDESGLQGMSLEQKRFVIRKCVTVRIHKSAKKGERKLDPARIKLSFFGDPGYVERAITPKEYARQQQAAAEAELRDAVEKRAAARG
ncbi:recombinase family protein [Streptomyces cinereoruber]|uniref:recombinase family protein n=1 Tax=Streptomyces cinereoruber TaxID=67260 RepID=UPI0036363DB3